MLAGKENVIKLVFTHSLQQKETTISFGKWETWDRIYGAGGWNRVEFYSRWMLSQHFKECQV